MTREELERLTPEQRAHAQIEECYALPFMFWYEVNGQRIGVILEHCFKDAYRNLYGKELEA